MLCLVSLLCLTSNQAISIHDGKNLTPSCGFVFAVIATDIFDKVLNDLRKDRWARAFSSSEGSPGTTTNNGNKSASGVDSDLRATIVLEHIIQASDGKQ